jgi:Dolichyl-phosphate-mannose-protein mannosyltransferase
MVTAATSSARRVSASAAASREYSPRWIRCVWSLPELLPIAVAGFGAPLVVLLLLDRVDLAWGVPLGLAGAVGATWLAGIRQAPVPRRDVLLTVVAFVLVAGWLAVGLRNSAQSLFAQRDSATYALTGRWLMDHSSLPIHTQPDLFGSPPGYDGTSAGFQRQTDATVFAQGNHLLPLLLAAAGWTFGAAAVLKANVVIAAMGLLAFFAVARRVVGSGFALVALVALAVSMPMIYVSRDTFTEPLALLFVMGGLALLAQAIESGRTRDYALAGFVSSMSAVVRIDAYAVLLSLLVVAAVLLAMAPPPERGIVARRTGVLVGAAAPMVVAGFFDVRWLSPGYYHNSRSLIMSLAAVAAILVVAGAVAVAVSWRWRVAFAARLTTGRGPVALSKLASTVLVVAFLILLSRPWWMTARGTFDNQIISGAQQAQGLAVDGTRLYSESTVDWQAMYLGWPTVILAVGGYAVLLDRLVRRRDYRLLGLLTTVLSLTALYLWTPQITPDQVWAMRRYVPVVMPGILIAAMAALQFAWRRWDRRGVARVAVRSVVAALCVAALVVPWWITQPVADLREEVPQIGQVDALCTALPRDAAVLVVDENLRWGYLQTIRSYCDVPALALVGARADRVASVQQAVSAHGRTLFVLAGDPSQLAYDGPVPPAFSSRTFTRWPSTVETPPTEPVRQTVRLYLGRAEPDGRVTPVR